MSRKICITVAFGVLLTVGLALALMLNRQPAMAAPATRPDAQMIHVTVTGADEPGCGAAAAPCASIRHALAQAADGDMIWVARGVYSETLAITTSVQLLGGFEASTWIRDIGAYTTVISGNQAGPVVHVSGSSTAVIEGFDIVDGAASSGAGITIEQAAPTIANCRIHDNHAIGTGGGIYVTSAAAPTIISNTIFANTAQTGGGVDVAGRSGGILRGNLIYDNRAARGGGLSLRDNVWPLVDHNTIGQRRPRVAGGWQSCGAACKASL